MFYIFSSILFSFLIFPIEDKNPTMFKYTLQTPSVQVVPKLDIIMNSLLQLIMLLFLPTELWHMVIMFSFIFDGCKAPNTPTDSVEICSVHRLQKSWQGSDLFFHLSKFFSILRSWRLHLFALLTDVMKATYLLNFIYNIDSCDDWAPEFENFTTTQ